MTTNEVYGYILIHKCILSARARGKLRALAKDDPDGAFMRMLEEVETKWRAKNDTMRDDSILYSGEWLYHGVGSDERDRVYAAGVEDMRSTAGRT